MGWDEVSGTSRGLNYNRKRVGLRNTTRSKCRIWNISSFTDEVNSTRPE